MTAENHELSLKKPVSFWNRELNIIPRDLFVGLGKLMVSGVMLDSKGAANNVLDLLKNIDPKDKPSHAAWLLVYRVLSLTLAEEELPSEREDRFSEGQNKHNF